MLQNARLDGYEFFKDAGFCPDFFRRFQRFLVRFEGFLRRKRERLDATGALKLARPALLVGLGGPSAHRESAAMNGTASHVSWRFFGVDSRDTCRGCCALSIFLITYDQRSIVNSTPRVRRYSQANGRLCPQS